MNFLRIFIKRETAFPLLALLFTSAVDVLFLGYLMLYALTRLQPAQRQNIAN